MDFPQIPWEILGFPWIFHQIFWEILGFPWISMDDSPGVHQGNPWIFMDGSPKFPGKS